MKNLLLIIAVMFFGVVNANAQISVNITQPTTGIHVPPLSNTIQVAIKGGVSVGKCLVVFIQDPTGQWWPYTNLSKISGSNNWHVEDVEFGKPKDHNLKFNIQAIIIEETALTKGLPVKGKTQYISNSLPILMPDYIAIREMYPNSLSEIISVIRQ